MKRLLVYCLLTAVYWLQMPQAFAQQLPNAPRNSAATLIYRLSHEDVKQLHLKNKPVSEAMLHTFVMSYRGDKIPPLERGNYLLARAVSGQMSYVEYIEDSFQVEVLSGAKPQIILLDTLGASITDARIAGWRYNSRSNTYTASKVKQGKVYEIDNRGVWHYITVGEREHYWLNEERPSWFARQWAAVKSWFKKKPDVYDGFVAFSKPKYKPAEVVRLKAYLTLNDKLYNRDVDVVLQRPRDMGGDTVLVHLTPYRAGMYEYEFKLSEALKLRLDYSYSVVLRDGQSNLLSDAFRYEEYELKSLKFTASMTRADYLASEPVEVRLKAVDENGLGIYDGRCQITVTSQQNGNALVPALFVPDTIWVQKIDMEGFSDKTVTIPADVFPDGYTGYYSVRCAFMTADNERREQWIGFNRKGDDAPRAKQKTAPIARFERFQVSGVRGKGSKNIKLAFENPDSLSVWYSVYCGEKLVEQGFGKAIEREFEAKESAYSLQFWYMMDDEVRQGGASLPYISQNISLAITAPANIYPGQEVEIGVDVTDRKGKPVADADITAYAYTSKFANVGYVRPVSLRFNGVADYKMPRTESYEVDEEFYNHTLKMDWAVWRERFGLDSLEFYRFLHPAPIYKYVEKAKGASVLPFAVVDGEAVGVQVLYIDNQPVYLKAAQQREVYAFAISRGYHSLTMRLPDRVVSYTRLFEQDERVILAIDATRTDTENGIYVEMKSKKERGVLADDERLNLNAFMVRLTAAQPYTNFRNMQVEEPLYLTNGGTLYDITNNNYGRLVGPFPYNGNQRINLLRHDGGLINWFPLNGARYDYIVDNHQVMMRGLRESAVPKQLDEYRPEFNLKDAPLTAEKLEREFETRVFNRFAWRSGAADKLTDSLIRYSSGCRLTLQIGREAGKDYNLYPMLVKIDGLLFYGSTTRFYALAEGAHKLTVVLRDGRYYTTDIVLRKGGMNYVFVNNIEPVVADDYSQKIVADQLEAYIQSLSDVSWQFYGGGEYELDEVVAVGYGSRDKMMVRGNSAIYGSRAEMSESKIMLDELSAEDVVVVAFGNASKTTFTGSAAQLQGAVAGMQVEDSIAVAPEVAPDADMPSQTSGNIRHNFHDDAFWQPRLTTDKAGRAVFTTTFPDDITQWTVQFIAIGTPKQTARQTVYLNSYLPLSARLSAPNFAIRGDEFNAIGRLTSYSDDTMRVRTPFGEVTFAKSYTADIHAVAGDTDSLTLEYSLLTDSGFTDGERRSLPVYPVGTLEAKGEFEVLERGGSHKFTVNATDKTTLHAEATQLGSLLDEIDRTIGYVYNCNEQMASKVKALASKRMICRAFGRPFEDDAEMRKLVTQLLKNRNADGFWGWWGVSNTEWWLSGHVVEALAKAQEEGYAVEWNIARMSQTLMLALRTNDLQLSDRALIMLHQIGATADYETLYKALPALPKEPSVRQQLARLETKATLGLADASDVAQIVKMASETMFGGLAWSEPVSELNKRYWCPTPEYTTTENTLAAYRTLMKIEDTAATRAKIRRYLFEQRRLEGWGNTYSTSRTIEAMLPDLMADGVKVTNPVLVVNNQRITEFPYTMEFAAGSEINVSAEGSAPIYVTAYQQVWNGAPEAVSADFTVSSKFMQNGKQVSQLTAGEPVDLVVSVIPRANASYVMIEVPIPAGCSYEAHDQNRWGEIHREYFKEKVSIFVRSMSVQTVPYIYTVRLIPRYTGSYTLNPARVELMYFPTFFGRTGMETVVVRGQ